MCVHASFRACLQACVRLQFQLYNEKQIKSYQFQNYSINTYQKYYKNSNPLKIKCKGTLNTRKLFLQFLCIMLHCFPFSNLTDAELEVKFQLQCNKTEIKKCLNDQNLRKYVFNRSKNPVFDNLDTDYYTNEQFNNKLGKVANRFMLSILHINIRNLNSKYREQCQFISLLDVCLDVLILSEV